MKFAEIYHSNLKSVKETLTSLWCSEAVGDTQKAYALQLKGLIDSKLFADESLYPVVQSMEYYKSTEGRDYESAMNLIGEDLWRRTKGGAKGFHPYVHQYECWKKLLSPNKESIVVTTGTGSGKTECFMLPLVRDLIYNKLPEGESQIQAIFLYPLNALMEDQKSRMQALLKDTHLHFAVYNGNLPEDDNNTDEIIEELRKYDRIIPTRTQLHQTPPDILLTNPTMLEYMLLRDKDQRLFKKGALKWIVVDEAHTFTGAGASELALLIRRVVNAFGVDPFTDLQFAASSATIGAGGDNDLKSFISDISGVPIDKVNVIGGEHAVIPTELPTDVLECRTKLQNHDFIRLDELLPGPDSIENKLRRLDDLCDRGVRAKVHFFYRVANNGIRVQLDNWFDRENGILKLLDRTPENTDATPALELKRCKHCGEYIATAEISTLDDTYKACADENSDIFSRMSSSQQRQFRVFGIVDKNVNKNNQFVTINGNHCTVDNNPQERWCIVASDLCQCPHCGASLTDNTENQNSAIPDSDEAVSIENVNERGLKAEPIRVSSDFISQALAPSLLSQLSESDHPDDDPHRGQQYISFVDSRQSAAQGTFKQNLDVERTWVYSRIYHKLCEDQASGAAIVQKINETKAKLVGIDIDSPEFDTLSTELKELKKKSGRPFAYLTWEEIFTYLNNDCKKESDAICKQFVNKESDNELDGGNINEAVKERYIFSVMLEQLSKYPPHSATAETMGLLESYYPSLSKAITPDAFREFNDLCGSPINDNFIDEEWKNLLKIYIDRVARSNEFLFMRMENHLDSDIFNCSSRFGLKKPSRRVARIPLVNKVEGKLPVIHILLAKMLGADKNNMRDVIKKNKASINKVIEAMWKSLVEETHLLQYSSRIGSRNKIYRLGTVRATDWKEDKDSTRDREWLSEHYEELEVRDKVMDPDGRQLRFNVAELAFKLPDKVYMCSVYEAKKMHYRPITSLFCGHSAYYDGEDVSDPLEFEEWNHSFPYIKDSNISEEQIIDWSKKFRNILYRYNLMGDEGCFQNKIINCLKYPEIFLQAEHTAQVDKSVSKASQILFQNHKINILACSTTMEMGVDLGDLDLVMMSSIPPHPANYKQRAGRSGRNSGNRSACITLCSSDIVGLRILQDPINTLISRPVSMPFVDMNCPAIIQRHANAFLFRTSGKFFNNEGRSNLSLTLLGCYSPYEFMKETKYTRTGRPDTVTNYWDLRNANGDEIFPNSADPLGQKTGTRFDSFRNWLINEANPLSLDFLLRGTSLEDKNDQVIFDCRETWESRRDELLRELSQIGTDYEEAYNAVKNDTDSAKNCKALSNGKLDTPFGTKLRWEYYHILRKNLIEYLATHRFTPNANMPVDVVEFNVNGSRITNPTPWKKQSDNPSYQLRQALSQYAPGNSVVKENRVLKVAGVDFIGKNRSGDKNPLLSFFTDGTDVVTDTMRNTLKNGLKIWPTSNKNELQLVQAKSFIPDINEDDSRILNTAPYTHVNAQLIGANKWDIINGYTHLAAMRSSSFSGNAKILYYNDGIGFGYCLCGKCGKMVLETGPSRGLSNLPQEMVNEQLMLQNKSILYGHNAIDRKNDDGKPRWCTPNNNKYFRNVILGDLIQTDFCEIIIREQDSSEWIRSRQDANTALLTTLGIVICKIYTEYIAKDRQSVDFLLMPTGSLCIFDTNPGGSGYSNKLSDPHVFNEVIHKAYVFLSSVTSKDALLDKFTLRYINDIDIARAKKWVLAELETWKDVPAAVKDAGLNAQWATMSDIVAELDDSLNRCSIFVNDSWDSWNYRIDNQYYDNEEITWKVRIEQLRRESVKHSIHIDVITVNDSENTFPPKLYDTAIEMKGWLNGDFKSASNILPEGFFPLAVVGNDLFITDNKANIAVDSQWAQGNVFRIKYDSVQEFTYNDVDLSHRPGTHAEFKLPMDVNYLLAGNVINLVHITSNMLFSIVSNFSKSKGVDLDGFLKSMSKKNEQIKLVYQDEHMKSGAGILVALQFIREVIKAAGKEDNFYLKFLNEEYYDFKGTDSYPFKGMIDHIVRNKVINNLTEQLYNEFNTNTTVCPFTNETKSSNGLTHWRVLTISCGDKQISIYPNGGFINEWNYDKYASISSFNDNNNLQIDNKIPLFRKKEIKYEVIIDKQ